MKGAKEEHSECWTHCSFTEKWTVERRGSMMSAAFLSPRERFRGLVRVER